RSSRESGISIAKYLGDMATRNVGTSWAGMASQLSAPFRNMVSSAISTANSIANAFNPLVSKVGNVAQRMMQSFGNGIQGMSNKAINGINGIMNKIGAMTKRSSSAGASIKSMFAAFSLANVAQRAMSMVTSSIDSAISRYDTMNQFPRVMEL